MRDAITALESALASLEHARGDLPDDLRTELDGIIRQARSVLESLGQTVPTEDAGRAGATG